MDRDKFTFFRSYFEAFSELPDELRLQCYDIVCEYALNGKEPEVEGIIKAIWKLIEPTVSKGIKMSDNGRRGGAPSGNNNAKSEEPEETKQEPNDNQTETKNNQTTTKLQPNLKQKQPNDNQTEKFDNQKTTGIGKGIGKGIGNGNGIGKGIGNGIGIGTDKQPNPQTTEPNHESSPDNVPYVEVVDAYNDFCPSLPRCTKLTDQRKKHIKARLKNNSIDSLKQAFLKAEESDFLAGRSGDWQADLNWIIKSEDNLTKILEGNYDNRNKSAQNSRDRPFSYMQFAGGEST